MIRTLVLVVAFSLFSFSGFAQDLKCKKFRTGTFVIPGDSIVPTSTLKRDGKFQYESISQDSSMVLDIKWIDDCNYVLKVNEKTPKSSLSEIELMIDREGGLRIEMLKTVNDTLYFRAKATLNGKVYPVDGIQIKTSATF